MNRVEHPRIVAVAVQYRIPRVSSAHPRANPLIISMPAPYRHHHILHLLYQVNSSAAIACKQGFLSNEGKFLNREDGKKLVAINGQPTIRSTHPTELFSEDLW